jgi:hypothetical protein
MLLKTIAIAGVSAAGGFMVAQQADKYLTDKAKFDDNWKPGTREAVRNGVAAGTGVGIFAVLSSVL